MTLPTHQDLDLSKLLLPIQPDDHVQGLPNARYTLVEYGDYECPACGQLFVTLRELHAQLGDELRLAFRHYPLSGVHHHAQQAAEAAEAAGAQGRFWEMHDLLFAHQTALGIKDLYRYAEQLSLDTERFREEVSIELTKTACARIFAAELRTEYTAPPVYSSTAFGMMVHWTSIPCFSNSEKRAEVYAL